MNTLLEFMEFTKGTSYLIAIAFLFAFLALWQLAHHRGTALAVKVVPLIILALGFGGLASTCVSPEGVTTMASQDGETALLSSPVLVDMYGPASFDHELHQAVADCTACHHNGDGPQPCKACHDTAFNPKNLNKPGVAHVYHLRCISCHKENQAGPTDCTGCHRKAAIPPLSISHPLTGVENCLSCHAAAIPGVPRIPADHAGATNGVCQLCHQPSVEAASLVIHELPHGLASREDCLMCHGEAIAGAGKVPANHAGRTNGVCQFCHQPSVEKTTSSVSGTEPTFVETTPAQGPTRSSGAPSTRQDRR